MTTFLIIILIIIFSGFLLVKFQNTNKPLKSDIKTSTKRTVNKRINQDATELYKKREIKWFELKGMFYSKLDPKSDIGYFVGYAQCEKNSHDKYAVAIYNQNNKLVGYTPKNNKRLSDSLNAWHNGKVLSWGFISHDDYDNSWNGSVNIPVGYSEDQLEKTKRILTLDTLNTSLISNKEKSTEKYFEILKNHKEIKSLLNDLKNPEEFRYGFPNNLIPSISLLLEKEKNWQKLIELESYDDLIEPLSDKLKQSTLNRIEKAKQNVDKILK